MTRYYECLIPVEDFTEDWQECAAFRFRKVPDGPTGPAEMDPVEIAGTVELEVTRDMDLLTRPEAS